MDCGDEPRRVHLAARRRGGGVAADGAGAAAEDIHEEHEWRV